MQVFRFTRSLMELENVGLFNVVSFLFWELECGYCRLGLRIGYSQTGVFRCSLDITGDPIISHRLTPYYSPQM